MRIVEQTPQCLKLKENKSRINLITLCGIPFVAAGVVTMLNVGEWVVVRCDRSEPSQVNCTIENRTLLRHETRSLSQIQGAEVEEITDNDGYDVYRVKLLTRGDAVPLTQASTVGRGGKQKTADTINRFIDAPDLPSLEVRQDFRWVAYPLGGVCILAGTAAILLGSMPFKRPFCELDKATGQGVWQGRQGFLLLPEQRFPLASIQEAKLLTRKDSEDINFYTAQLVLKTGEILPICDSYNAVATETLIKTINQFLGRSPESQGSNQPHP